MINMRTEKVKAVATIFEIEEIQAMEKVGEALTELRNKFGTEHTLMSVETGEIVGVAEIDRVLGILEALTTHRCWELVDEEFRGMP